MLIGSQLLKCSEQISHLSLVNCFKTPQNNLTLWCLAETVFLCACFCTGLRQSLFTITTLHYLILWLCHQWPWESHFLHTAWMHMWPEGRRKWSCTLRANARRKAVQRLIESNSHKARMSESQRMSVCLRNVFSTKLAASLIPGGPREAEAKLPPAWDLHKREIQWIILSRQKVYLLHDTRLIRSFYHAMTHQTSLFFLWTTNHLLSTLFFFPARRGILFLWD